MLDSRGAHRESSHPTGRIKKGHTRRSVGEVCSIVGFLSFSEPFLGFGVHHSSLIRESATRTKLQAMEVYGKSMIAEPSNVIYLSSILNKEGLIPSHKCDKRCQNEHVFGNMYRCKLTGLTHICDKNCEQRILYDNHSSLCRVSGQFFPLSPAEEQAVRGVRRKLEVTNTDGCAFKRRRDSQLHPSPFERIFSAVSPICSQIGDGMDMS